MTSNTQRMEKIVLYGAIGLVIVFMLLVLILALARPIQAAQARLNARSPFRTHAASMRSSTSRRSTGFDHRAAPQLATTQGRIFESTPTR